MKKTTAAILLAILFHESPLFSQGSSYPLNISLWYPLSINQSADDHTIINLPLVYGHVGTITGINLGLGASIVENHVYGLQINGALSWTHGEVRGLSLSGFANLHGDAVKGIDAAVLVNFIEGDMYGAQLAAVYNYVLGDMHGFQWSAFINLAGENAGYLQIGNANIAGADFTGLQGGVVFNYAGNKMVGMQTAGVNISGELHGWQLGGGNLTDESKGLQTGIVNLAKIQKGLQIGIVNIAGEQRGVPFGLLNFAGNADYDWITYTGNYNTFNTGIKMSANQFFSIVDIGSKPRDSEKIEDSIVGFHWGYDFEIIAGLRISPDLGYIYMEGKKGPLGPDNEHKAQFAIQLRLVADYKLTSFLKILAGIGSSQHIDVYENNEVKKEKFIYLFGLSLF